MSILSKEEYKNLVLTNIMQEGKLYPLQFQIYRKLIENDFVFVYDEVGCGKTIEAGIAIKKLIDDNEHCNILVIAPNNLLLNWYSELMQKFGLGFIVLEGNKDYQDPYLKAQNQRQEYFNYINAADNFVIVSNSASEGTNLGLTRITEEYSGIDWDLIVIDEGHEQKNENSKTHKSINKLKAKKVIFMSATPIKNIEEDLKTEIRLVQNLLNNSGKKIDVWDVISKQIKNPLSLPEMMISFDKSFPMNRSFKEVINSKGSFKKREIKEIKYKVDYDIMDRINASVKGLMLDRNKGSIMLFETMLMEKNIYSIYQKEKYGPQDVAMLRSFDNKADVFLKTLDGIFGAEGGNDNRVVVFCNHKKVVDYLGKLCRAVYNDKDKDVVEAVHGDTHSSEERKKMLSDVDRKDTETGNKKIFILSHKIGSQGINFASFNHLINYELPDTPADLEQRFGRIDRITNKFDPLYMYFFKDENGKLDQVYFYRILRKTLYEVIPILPSKVTLNFYKWFEPYMIYIRDVCEGMRSYQNRREDIRNDKDLLEDIEQLAEVYYDDIKKEFRYWEEGISKAIGWNDVQERLDKMFMQFCGIFNISVPQSFADVTDDIIKQAIDKVEKIRADKVIYRDANNHEITYDYSQISAMAFPQADPEVKKLQTYIADIEKEIISSRVKLMEHDLKEIIKDVYFLMRNDSRIKQQEVLYGIYSTLKAEKERTSNDKFCFRDVIKTYNEMI